MGNKLGHWKIIIRDTQKVNATCPLKNYILLERYVKSYLLFYKEYWVTFRMWLNTSLTASLVIPGSASEPLMVYVFPLLVCP